MQALGAQPLPAVSEVIRDELQRLHPPQPPDQSFTPQQRSFVSDVHIHFNADDVRRHVNSLGKLVAPGVSKFRYEHIRQLFGGTNEDNGNRFCLALTSYLLRIARGLVPPILGKFLSSAPLIALSKGQGKVRPIAMGDFLRKISMGVALDKAKEKIKLLFGGVQLGMSRLGCETIFRKSNATSQLHPDFDRIFTDAINAFNEGNRSEAFDQMTIYLPEFVGYYLLLYGHDSDLWYDFFNNKATRWLP